jgi:hypothetical protein
MQTVTRTHTTLESPVGELTLVAEAGALVGLYFPGHWYLPDPGTFGSRTEDGWDDAATQLGEYFAGRRQSSNFPSTRRATTDGAGSGTSSPGSPTARRSLTATWPRSWGTGPRPGPSAELSAATPCPSSSPAIGSSGAPVD